MNKILRVLVILTVIGLLGMTGIAFSGISSSEISYIGLVFSGIGLVSADHSDCDPAPGYPNDCHGIIQ